MTYTLSPASLASSAFASGIHSGMLVHGMANAMFTKLVVFLNTVA